MRELSTANSDKSLLLRMDFSDQLAWEALCEAVQVPSDDGFVASFDFVSDPVYSGIKIEELLELQPKGAEHNFLFIADAECLANSEHPILVVDLHTEPGRTFRVIPSEVWAVENNLSISNMDFEEFANEADLKGVFRGFTD